MSNEDISLPLEFQLRLTAARAVVSEARLAGNQFNLANALKELGNIERRPPFLRESANESFAEAVELYRELALPLEAAWVLRHIGINKEYAERLEEAEQYYDESLALFRVHADRNSLDYANTVRYPAVIKNRLGKRDDSAALWMEAVERYQDVNIPAGVAEGSAWLALFSIEGGDPASAVEWLAKADAAAATLNDTETSAWVNSIHAKFEKSSGFHKDS